MKKIGAKLITKRERPPRRYFGPSHYDKKIKKPRMYSDYVNEQYPKLKLQKYYERSDEKPEND